MSVLSTATSPADLAPVARHGAQAAPATAPAPSTRHGHVQPAHRRSTVSRLAYHYPLTVLGTGVLIAALYLLGSAFGTGSPFEFLLSIFAFVSLLMLGLLSRWQAYRFKLVDFEWDTTRALHAREHGTGHRLHTRSARAWLFFRIHLRIGWRLQAGRRATIHGYREVAGPGGELPIPLWFPTSGRLALHGRLSVRDVFGLTRAQIRAGERRELIVRPGKLGEQAAPPIDVSVGYETTQRAKTADEEKYYMREYMPGDRMKDINWKATSRLDELITRISPVTQDQTQLLHVVLRRYRRRGGETLASVLHLDFAKSWLLTFLRVVKQNHQEFHFEVDTGGGESHLLETPEDIDAFARVLAELPLTREVQQQGETIASELFVFSTMFDEELPHFVQRCGAGRVNVFRTVGAAHAEHERRAKAYTADFDPEPAARAAPATVDAYPLCLNETPLPSVVGGPWLVATERGYRPVSAGPPARLGMLEEQPVAVRYLCSFSS